MSLPSWYWYRFPMRRLRSFTELVIHDLAEKDSIIYLLVWVFSSELKMKRSWTITRPRIETLYCSSNGKRPTSFIVSVSNLEMRSRRPALYVHLMLDLEPEEISKSRKPGRKNRFSVTKSSNKRFVVNDMRFMVKDVPFIVLSALVIFFLRLMVKEPALYLSASTRPWLPARSSNLYGKPALSWRIP